MKVMCISQTEAEDVFTSFKHHSTPKFGNILTVALKVYEYETKEDYYFFEEFGHWPGGCMFQAKFFVPVDDIEMNEDIKEKEDEVRR